MVSQQDSDFTDVASLLLEMPQELSHAALLSKAVRTIASWDSVALVRVWRLLPGDICERCRFADECPKQVDCLHLVASRGASIRDADANWNKLEGGFSRFPYGVRKVGHVAKTGEAVTVNLKEDRTWVADPEWAVEEGIRAINAQPLVFRRKVLGVLGIFLRKEIDPRAARMHRMIADHMAMAMANAEAFEEIAGLKAKLELENEYLRSELEESHQYGDIVGTSEPLRQIVAKIDLVAPTDASVLIYGESGTGKELVAREIHRRSTRAERPMVRVNCASIPAPLFESELFGHTKGAFTGALRDRAGRFEAADGGTLFLDEIGEIPLDLQAKLLRVLQEGQYERVGEDVTRKVSVRVVAATNRKLQDEVKARRFREDLYYRLNVFPVDVPPLRERKEDISLLVKHFMKHGAARLKVPEPQVSKAQMDRLRRYDWPGNIRELQNVVERGLIAGRRGGLRFDVPIGDGESEGVEAVAESGLEAETGILDEEAMKAFQRANIVKALKECGGQVYGSGGAAELLGLRPSTLVSRMKAHGLALKVSSGLLD